VIIQSSQSLQSLFNLLPFIRIIHLLNFCRKIHEYQNLDTKLCDSEKMKSMPPFIRPLATSGSVSHVPCSNVNSTKAQMPEVQARRLNQFETPTDIGRLEPVRVLLFYHTSNLIPCANGNEVPKLIVLVCLLI
jgi:hypothetical protein